jgi:hypothetical protein
MAPAGAPGWRGASATLPAGLRAALARLDLGHGAAGGAHRGAAWAPGARGLRPFAYRPACQCGGVGGIAGSDAWSQQAKLTASDGYYFGTSVALSSDGNTALIGKPNGNSGAGAAYVFVRSGSSWVQAQKLTAADGTSGDRFGESVALKGDGSILLIGAPGKNRGIGAAYGFVRIGSTWLQLQELTGDTSSYDEFGRSVAMSSDGSTMLIGAPYQNDVGNLGVVYVFVALPYFGWGKQAVLTSSDGYFFGESVALSSNGNTALIGAPGADDYSTYTYPAAAYGFVRNGTTWSQPSRLTSSDGHFGDEFGESVALSSDGITALIGAPYARNYNAGAAYVFVSFFGWQQQTELIAADSAANDYLGRSVGLSGDGTTALIGASGKNNGTGAAYTFQGSWSSWKQTGEPTASDGHVGDGFGEAVALSSDGSTRVIGAPYKNGTGAAYVFKSSAPPTTIFTTQTPAASYSGAFELGVKFQSTVAGHIKGLRYYRVAGESGTHIGHLWSAGGTLLGTVTFTGESASGWQTASFATPIAILANTTYVASVNSNVAFGTTDSGLATSVSDRTLKTVADGQNGVYNASGLFPNLSYLSRNYFRDVVFVTP